MAMAERPRERAPDTDPVFWVWGLYGRKSITAIRIPAAAALFCPGLIVACPGFRRPAEKNRGRRKKRSMKKSAGICVHPYQIFRRIPVSRERIRHGERTKEACFIGTGAGQISGFTMGGTRRPMVRPLGT